MQRTRICVIEAAALAGAWFPTAAWPSLTASGKWPQTILFQLKQGHRTPPSKKDPHRPLVSNSACLVSHKLRPPTFSFNTDIFRSVSRETERVMANVKIVSGPVTSGLVGLVWSAQSSHKHHSIHNMHATYIYIVPFNFNISPCCLIPDGRDEWLKWWDSTPAQPTVYIVLMRYIRMKC